VDDVIAVELVVNAAEMALEAIADEEMSDPADSLADAIETGPENAVNNRLTIVSRYALLIFMINLL
jgi:hypothetical protein